MSERAQIAMHLASGWLASFHPEVVFDDKLATTVASQAVKFADALLAELAKPKTEGGAA